MQKNTTIIFVVVALIVGLGAGYTVGVGKVSDTQENDENPSMMNHMMMNMNSALEGKTGDAFDKAFLSEMIVHHEGAVEMAESALRDAKHQEIKDLAKSIIEAQEKEIADMKAWKKSWYTE